MQTHFYTTHYTDPSTASPCSRLSFFAFRLLISAVIAEIWWGEEQFKPLTSCFLLQVCIGHINALFYDFNPFSKKCSEKLVKDLHMETHCNSFLSFHGWLHCVSTEWLTPLLYIRLFTKYKESYLRLWRKMFFSTYHLSSYAVRTTALLFD